MNSNQPAPSVATRRTSATRWRIVRGSLVLLMGCSAVVAPFLVGTSVVGTTAVSVVGVLLVVCGVLEALQTFQTPDERARRATYVGGALSIGAGLVLLARPVLAIEGMVFLLAGLFVLDGFAKIIAAWRARSAGKRWIWTLIPGVAIVMLAVLIGIQWPIPGLYSVGVLVGLRMIAAGWSILIARDDVAGGDEDCEVGLHPDRRLGLPPHAELGKLEATLTAQEDSRSAIDRSWCATFIIIFFAIHVGRVEAEWTLLGMITPTVAVFGDVCMALLLAFGVLLPARLAWRAVTRPVERRAWHHVLGRIDAGRGVGLVRWPMKRWLTGRMRFSFRMRAARFSPRTALRWALRVGLPLTAVLIALNPIWGFSWYFNTENWATEIWDRYAESRADAWREEMVRAVRADALARGVPEARLFQVEPPGVAGVGDFSFLVMGDTGEGDASQFCLKDQFLALGQQPEVKFLVISSDVIYPSGAMKDYEPKFYLPFKGFTKPIYAIPGNHDWYDALEAFAANFLDADAARAAIRARVDADHGLTSTNEARIMGMVEEAARLRQDFGVRTGGQRGPYFELQSERFALIAVDTGVVRRMDPDQRAWLEAALNRARSKFRFVILGHPLYAGGRYQGADDEPFAAIHQLLREHEVEVVMAGDTHYFEHYRESYATPSGPRPMLHFVNGGGGAYLSIGTPLDWPKTPAVPDCAFYPRTDAVIAKLNRETPYWKLPIWEWVKHFGAWPSSAEAMASAFDFNKAPSYQSFVEVRVEGSANVVRLRPHGTSGRLRWRDLQTYGQVVPAGQGGDGLVEFVVPITATR